MTLDSEVTKRFSGHLYDETTISFWNIKCWVTNLIKWAVQKALRSLTGVPGGEALSPEHSQTSWAASCHGQLGTANTGGHQNSPTCSRAARLSVHPRLFPHLRNASPQLRFGARQRGERCRNHLSSTQQVEGWRNSSRKLPSTWDVSKPDSPGSHLEGRNPHILPGKLHWSIFYYQQLRKRKRKMVYNGGFFLV